MGARSLASSVGGLAARRAAWTDVLEHGLTSDGVLRHGRIKVAEWLPEYP